MLGEKYSKLFLEINKAKDNSQVIKNIIEIEKRTNVNFTEWKDDQFFLFLKEFGSVSPSALRRRITILKKFADLVCKEENVEEQEYLIGNDMLLLFIDNDKLLQETLSYQQFQNIRRQLGTATGEETINYRDKVIFELAWFGLTENEIRLLKRTDIEFIVSKEGMDIALLNLVTNKVIRIEDLETIEDIKQCIKTDYRVTISKRGKADKRRYVDSPYLIRPIATGIVSKEYVDKPNVALKGFLDRAEITCEGIDVSALSLEDIRRSRLILLLAPENEKFFDFKTVAGLYDLKSKYSIQWYKEIAKMKYSKH